MRIFLIAAILALTGCQTLNPAPPPGTASASSGRIASLVQLVGCLKAEDPDLKISRCTGLINSASEIEAEPEKRNQLLSTAHVLRGSAYLDKRDDRAAERDIERAIAFNPENAGAYLARSVIWQRKDDFVEMLRDLDKAVAFDPDSAIVYAARAHARIALAFPDSRRSGPLETNLERDAIADARADIVKSRTLDPEYSAPWRLLADIHFELAEYDSAIGNYGEAIKRNSSDAKAFQHRGSAFFRIDDTAGAIQDFQTAIRLDPRDPGSYVKLGWIRAAAAEPRFRDGARAVELALEANRIAGDQQHVTYLMLLPVAYAEAGWFEEAIGEQERIIEIIKGTALSSDDDDTRHLLGLYVGAEELLQLFRNRQPFRLTRSDTSI
jgi:tetratricopeptide (TPR) repeat protein